MVDFHKAILKLHNTTVAVDGNTPDDIKAYDANGNEVTIDWTLVNSWVDPDQYKYDRASAYASLAEQLDMQYWDRVNGTSTWKEHIDAVKAAHPKPTGE